MKKKASAMKVDKTISAMESDSYKRDFITRSLDGRKTHLEETIPATKGFLDPEMISAKIIDSSKGFITRSSKGENMAVEEFLEFIKKKKEEEEERIPLMELFSEMHRIRRLMEKKRKLKCLTDSKEEEISPQNLGSEEDSESENEICRSPEEIKGFSYYHDSDFSSEEDESESDEDLLEDRDEYDWGFNFVVKKRSRTVTNPKIPQKIYFKSEGGKARVSIPCVLHDLDFPLAAISKLALKTYNTIRDTEYEYVGLVKAYKQAVNGFRFWTRFKARLPGQVAIYFQAITFQGRPNRKTNDVTLQFESVYPLPPSPAIRRTERKIPQRKRRGRGGQYPRRR